MLSSPNADLPVILGTFHFQIVKDGTTDFNAGIGTGPYKLKEFKPGVRSVVVRNENYWKPGKPYLDEIEFVGIGDESARVNALLSGGIDLVGSVNPRARSSASRPAAGSRSSRPSRASTPTSIMRKDAGPGQQPGLRAGDEVPVRPRADDARPSRSTTRWSPTTSRSTRPTASTSRACRSAPSIPRRPSSTCRRPALGQHARPGGGFAGGAVLGRDGPGDAADGAADRPEPRCQAHAGRRLLVQPLAQQPGGLRQRQPAPERRHPADAVLQVRCALERVALEEREVRPAAGGRARRVDHAKRKQMYADMQTHDPRRRPASASRCSSPASMATQQAARACRRSRWAA